MEIEKFLHEISIGDRINILKLVMSGTNRKSDIMRNASFSDSVIEVSLRFLVDAGMLKKKVVSKGNFYPWKVLYEITDKGVRLVKLVDEIDRYCNGGDES